MSCHHLTFLIKLAKSTLNTSFIYIQNEIIDPESCRLCQEDEESSYHVIAECPALQAYRGKIFQLPNPTILPDPAVWSVMQISKFLRESPVGNMLDGNEYE